MKLYAASLAAFLIISVCAYCLSIPRPVGYVNDLANVLTANDAYSLESRLTGIEKDTGIEIAIVTTNDLKNETIEAYSVELFQQWGIGKKGQDNGLLILLVPSTRQYRFEVGYGLEGVLNDAKVGRFGRDCFQTYFANDSYFDGFSCALDEITSEMSGTEPMPHQTDYATILIIVIVVIVIIILAIITKGGIFRILFLIIGVVARGGFGGGRSGGGGAGGKY
jgi:uncharacterized protein